MKVVSIALQCFILAICNEELFTKESLASLVGRTQRLDHFGISSLVELRLGSLSKSLHTPGLLCSNLRRVTNGQWSHHLSSYSLVERSTDPNRFTMWISYFFKQDPMLEINSQIYLNPLDLWWDLNLGVEEILDQNIHYSMAKLYQAAWLKPLQDRDPLDGKGSGNLISSIWLSIEMLCWSWFEVQFLNQSQILAYLMKQWIVLAAEYYCQSCQTMFSNKHNLAVCKQSQLFELQCKRFNAFQECIECSRQVYRHAVLNTSKQLTFAVRELDTLRESNEWSLLNGVWLQWTIQKISFDSIQRTSFEIHSDPTQRSQTESVEGTSKCIQVAYCTPHEVSVTTGENCW